MKNKVQLGDIANIYSGGTPSRSEPSYWGGNIPWLKTAQIQNKTINEYDVDEWITEKGLLNSSAKMVPKGSILMAMYGQGKTRGQVAILGLNATINQACAAIQLKKLVDRDYVFQQLLFRYKAIRSLSNSGSQENLSAGLIKEITFPLPTFNAQKIIATTLSTWDSAIKKTEKLIEAKEKRYKWLLDRLIAKESKKSKWRRVKLGEVAEIVKADKLQAVNDEILLTVKLHCKGIERNTRIKPKLSERGRPYYKRHKGEFLIGRQNFHNGGFGILPNELEGLIASNAITSLKIKRDKMDTDFLFYFFSRKAYYKRVGYIMGGTGQKELSDKQILKLNIHAPSLRAQQQIAKSLNTAQKEINLLKKRNEKYKLQKRGLMQKLLTGQWRVTNA